MYLNLVYQADFGPTPVGQTQRTDALPLIRHATDVGVPVDAWITVPLADGTFANEQNAAVIRTAVQSFQEWSTSNQLTLGQAVLDLEFPAGTQAVAQALDGDLSGVEQLAHANIDPADQRLAMSAYGDTISWAHQHGLRLAGILVAFALDDLANGGLALQDALDIVDHGQDRPREMTEASDLGFHPRSEASVRPSGRQDSNLRPLDPQPGHRKPLTSRNRESPAHDGSVDSS
ncbi:hypothetical protein F0L68_33605 [Solihabitans fulvus]|uniref:Uncharacterized protein n=1 Tax=Solihabitans fulvus TaxID=1892852 RepID=A0A5B2WRR1_9PSEU|nr:hypothetical protein [Solihabitans fulvus]KAA2253089.1 hypothetical protein F0L68_33605 [Solihabitans fulvus]